MDEINLDGGNKRGYEQGSGEISNVCYADEDEEKPLQLVYLF